mgnify:CR=1 FL=1
MGLELFRDRLVTLAELLKNYAYSFVELNRILIQFRKSVADLIIEFRENPKIEVQTVAGEYARDLLNDTSPLFDDLDLKVCRGLVDKLADDVELKDFHDLVPRVEFIAQAIEIELRQKLFLYVRESFAKYYGQEKLFSDAVYDRFRSARDDIKAAGNCYAVGQDAACAFHLMRVIELGLRVVADDMGISWAQGIEYKELGPIIDKLEAELDKRRKVAATPPLDSKKEAELVYLRTVITETAFYKDVKRNPFLHVRVTYNEGEALGLLLRVREFMQTIAERVQEKPGALETSLIDMLRSVPPRPLDPGAQP